MNSIIPGKNKLGFVGIGYMGRPIAKRLLEAGFKVMAYDRDRSKANELVQFGGTVAGSIAEVASSCDVVLSSLPNDDVVLDVYK
jgi:3-hydroxyisobutyrate dehydrogenase-like beta-hydroxyacid dehydrogenase